MNDVPAFLRVQVDGVSLQVKVVPRASRNEIGDILGDRLKIRVAAPPVDAAANHELVAFLARSLGVPRSDVNITRGQVSRNKTVHIRGAGPDAIQRVINRAGA
jgi:uncharacterized protein (TIGR00251 family)